MNPLEEILMLAEQHGAVRETGSEQWTAHCPAHEDKHPSLGIATGDKGGTEKVLVHCLSGCTTEEVVAAWGLSMKDLYFDRDEPSNGQPRQTPRPPRPKKPGPPPEELPTEGEVAAWNVALLANEAAIAKCHDTKGWSRAALEKLGIGLHDRRLCFPIRDADGALINVVRYTPTPEGDAPKALALRGRPRGLFPAPETIGGPSLILVEGEGDAVAGATLSLPVVAIPGVKGWKQEYVERFKDRRVALCFDADEHGRKLAERVAGDLTKAGVTNWIVDLDESRHDGFDLSDHLVSARTVGDGREGLVSLVKEACRKTHGSAAEDDAQDRQSKGQPKKGDDDEEPEPAEVIDREEEWEKCKELAQKPRILDAFKEQLASAGLVGEDINAQIVYLATTSRLFDMPCSVAVKGPSAGGKSFTVQTVLKHFPDSAYYALTAVSERALAYSNVPLEHRMLVLYEDAGIEGDWAELLLRTLLSEGCIRYETVETGGKEIFAKMIERKGPTGLIITTTKGRLHPENETRLVSLTVQETPEQTKSIFRAIAREDESEEPDLEPWHALQRWLEPKRVVIPYGEVLADQLPPVAVRMRRDFMRLLGFVKAHCLLHQATRETDKKGRLIATIEDYAVVRELVAGHMSADAGATVRPEVRQVVEAVAELREAMSASPEEGVKQREIVQHLDLEKGTVSRRVRDALRDGYLRNLETRRGHPHKLVLGDPIPDEIVLLPEPDEVSAALATAAPVAADTNGHAGITGETESALERIAASMSEATA